jgi:hypothetical protein
MSIGTVMVRADWLTVNSMWVAPTKENKSANDLCTSQVEARVQAQLETVENNPPQRIRPCDLQKLINSLKLRKACGIDGIPMNASGTLQGDHWFTQPIYSIIAFGSLIFQIFGRKQN